MSVRQVNSSCAKMGEHCVQVYDVCLDAALQAQNCGPRNLQVTGEWQWLLQGFAGQQLSTLSDCLCCQIHHNEHAVLHLPLTGTPQFALTACCFNEHQGVPGKYDDVCG